MTSGIMLEVDPIVLEKPEEEDYDSTGYDTSTASLSSSFNQYFFENGRQYHSYYGKDKYLLPTDKKERDRLDFHHEIMRLAWDDDLHKAPLKKPRRILDVGTGTGIWAIDMADKYPMAVVIGTDISPIQPKWVPANCRFEVDDAMLNWTFKNVWLNSFDYIHARNISSGVSNWKHLVAQMMRCTVPGGYVELSEMEIKAHCDDGSMKADNGLKIYVEHLRESMRKMGRQIVDANLLKNLLEEAGFEDIQTFKAVEPVGPWPKDPKLKKIGAMTLLHTDGVFESYGMAAFSRVLGMDNQQVRDICERARLDSLNKNYHIYCVYYRVYGRKPMTMSTATRRY